MDDQSTSANEHPSYFFVAVSTKENLNLCREYGLAGFPGSYNGAWAFVDIDVGDYVTFVYGAKAHNLYRVKDKRALADAKSVPPWPSLELTRGGTYHFPFRLDLEPERTFTESLVRTEFQYIAENLLLRGGYARSHFQADQTTLQQVSQMGDATSNRPRVAEWEAETVIPKWVRRRGGFDPPRKNKFIEEILHVLLREYLERSAGSDEFAQMTGFTELSDRDVEILGERALPEGHLDLLVKDARPVGDSIQLPIEVKLNRCSDDDVEQLTEYIEQLHPESPGGVLIAERVPGTVQRPKEVRFIEAGFGDLDLGEPQPYGRMREAIELTLAER